MKTAITITIIFITGILQNISASDADADTLFKYANQAYTKAEYETAIEVYEQLIDEGFSSFELFYNLGNAYFKQNNISKSILNYEKARMIRPYNKDLQNNLEIADEIVVDQINEVPGFFLKVWTENIAFLLGHDSWGLLSIVLFILMALCILIFLFTSWVGLKKWALTIAVLGLMLSAISFSLAHKRYNLRYNNNTAVISAQTINIKSSPDLSGTDLFVLHEGTKVQITDEVNEWYEIRIADGNKGWIPMKDVETI